MTVRGQARADSTGAADAVKETVQNALATAQSESQKEPIKRGPGRPPGSRNKKPPGPIPPQTAKTPATPPTPKKETERIVESAKERNSKKDTANAPDFTEWSEFLGEVVLHWFSVAFVAVALRGIPYHDIFSEADYEDIQLDEDELKAVARPFAHLAAHSGLNTKYGRMIMNSRDSIEASVVMFMWMGRVRRIGNKYKRWMNQQMEMENSNVTRIKPDRERSAESATPTEEFQPVPGIAHAAFGHGFN